MEQQEPPLMAGVVTLEKTWFFFFFFFSDLSIYLFNVYGSFFFFTWMCVYVPHMHSVLRGQKSGGTYERNSKQLWNSGKTARGQHNHSGCALEKQNPGLKSWGPHAVIELCLLPSRSPCHRVPPNPSMKTLTGFLVPHWAVRRTVFLQALLLKQIHNSATTAFRKNLEM